MLTPYQPVHPNARKEIAERKVFFLRRASECDDILRSLDSLDALFNEHPVPGLSSVEGHRASPVPDDDGRTGESIDVPLSSHRRKEDLYDTEMLQLLAQVKVASKQAVFQHFHRVLRGNTSIGAVESYLKRAVLRGVIVRRRRGEYTLPPRTD